MGLKKTSQVNSSIDLIGATMAYLYIESGECEQCSTVGEQVNPDWCCFDSLAFLAQSGSTLELSQQ